MGNNTSMFFSKGLKKTKQRESVLKVLLEADRPLTAMEIYTDSKKAGTILWLSTVYRILELFTLKGIVDKNILSGDDMASYVISTNEHKHYAVCIACHRITVLDNCPILQMAGLNNFHITGHKFEIFGYCDNCYEG